MDYHDLLARLGVSHAHPGGRRATDIWQRAVSISPTDNVLDVGCGNGATACELSTKYRCSVTALDVRPKMVANTKRRAKLLNVDVQARQGRVEALPFPDQTFDLVISESVLVFCNVKKAVNEMYRVLKPGGKIVDVEMMTLHPVDDAWRDRVKRLYGAVHVPDLSGWKQIFMKHFSVRVIQSGPLNSLPMGAGQQEPDLADPNAMMDPKVIRLVEANGKWIEENQHTMGFGVFLLEKQNSSS